MKWPSLLGGKPVKPRGGPKVITCPLAQFTPPDDLLSAMRKAECVLIGGEQLSVVSAVLSYPKFLRSLVDWLCESGGLTDLVANQIRARIVTEETDLAWTMLLPGMRGREAMVLDYARSAYMRPTPFTKIHEAAAKLSFSGVITPNLDPMLEKLFERRQPQCIAASETNLFAGGFCVLKLRGIWERPETVILDPRSAAESNRKNDSYRKFVEATYAVHRLLFLGTSPVEVSRLLDGLNLQPQTNQHLYVLSAIEDGDKATRKAWEAVQATYGFALLTYAPAETGTVCQFLEKLREPVLAA